jgi:hypothetical protein
MAQPARTPGPDDRRKLPVVAGRAGSPSKQGTKAARAKAGGWAAFTDGGAAPGWVVAARLVLAAALLATVPVVIGVEDGRRILWTIAIASLPAFFVLGGYHLWRRICPLAVVGQLGRLVGRPGGRKVGDWLGERYFLVQFALLFTGLSLRLIAINGTPAFLGGFLIAVVIAAAIVSFVFAGKTWCNFICPVGVVEKMYTEPSRLGGSLTSQCAPCVACKKHCPDIDLEGGYWKEAQDRPRRIVYFTWPGVVVAFYVYYWLVHGDWRYYFDGWWTTEDDLASKWLDAGFHFAPLDAIPRVVAAPLTLAVFGAASYLVFSLGERIALGRARRDADPGSQAERDAAQRVRHRALVLAGFIAFNTFYFFAGQPTLRRFLDPWALTGWTAIVVLASAAIFFRRWGRREADHVQEKFAQKILKKWEWGDAPPSNDLQDIYLLHTERTKQREARLRAYKETVRELVADGVVTRGEMVILDSLRAQLGITDKDHQKVIAELSEEERQLFDPTYQGSVEQRLQRQQYRRDLERLVVDAARAGHSPTAASLDALRTEYDVPPEEQAAELERIVAADGPVVALLGAEIAALQKLAAAAAAAAADVRPGEGAGGESASLAFVRFLAMWRGGEHLHRALGLLAAISPRRDLDDIRHAVTVRPAQMAHHVARLRGVVDDSLAVPLIAATEALATGTRPILEPGPLLAVATDGSAYLRAAVAILLSRFDDDASRGALIAALDDPDPIVREAAVRALGSRRRLTRDILTKVLADGEARVRQAAVRAVSGTTSGELPAAPDPGLLAQTVKGVGNSGMYATLDANASMATLTTIERMMLLRNVPMLAALTPGDLDELASVVHERIFHNGEDLCRQGEAGDAVFVVVKGRVKVFTGDGTSERVLSQLGAGACIGEMAVLDDAPRSATVRAIERTRAVVIPGGGFKDLMSTRPEMAQAIIGELVRRMRGMMQQR